jgi:hypothetical protein
MHEHEITFKLTDTQKIVITTEETLNEIHCCSNALIMFHKDNDTLKLENDSLSYNLHTFISLLTDALNNKLPLHESIQGKAGYLAAHYSFYLLDKDKLTQLGLVLDKDDNWVGENYQLWGWDFAGWIYNDEKGNIIFELTPRYKGGWYDPDNTKNVKEYKEFLVNYKSYFITTIPHKVAQRWIAQANDILKQIDENVKRGMKESEKAENFDA